MLALVTGTLFRDPETRAGKESRREFVTATIEQSSGEPKWVNVVVFSESLQDELRRLRAGDALAAQGQLTIKTYIAKDGSTKIQASVAAKFLLPLRHEKRFKQLPPDKPANRRSQAMKNAKIAPPLTMPHSSPSSSKSGPLE